MAHQAPQDQPSVFLIAGPTASGKSALALRLAERLGGEIVNADALQLYADLRLLSARPDAAEEQRAPHHLYGVADGADGWSVGRWLKAALPLLDDIRRRGRAAIVVGGTGLYFRALTHGLAEIPDTPPEARQEAEAQWRTLGEAAFRERLASVDPQAEARIEQGDRQRLVRAMEVHAASGRPLTYWQAQTRPPLAAADWRAAVLEPQRAWLYARCDARMQAMVEAGALDEVARLMARGLDPAAPVMKAVGVRELGAHLAGETSLEAAVALAQQQTRRYAKRQSTWLRNQTPDWPRLAGETDAEAWLRAL
ncbi:MAG TPA: tRNA (adenosine(37)-N6)-dimethylallyltransferase MiaA [Caulobacteraceae bacterium]|nr:tRNA (adenosine(37)-N6)-dimethylallyltransferase MiaA [Caulobacteraceae bacterium]